MHRLLRTTDDVAIAIIRITLGIVFFPHGAQKVLGWFGGDGWSGTMQYFTQGGHHFPAPIAALVMAGELLAALSLISGLLGRLGAFGVLAIMLGAIFLTHLPNGFFMNWSGSQAGEGYEYHLLAIAMAVAVMIRGSGALSLDRYLTSRQPAPAY